MNMFARFDENPAMTLWVIKETKRYGRTDARTDNVKTVYPLQTKFAGGITMFYYVNGTPNILRDFGWKVKGQPWPLELIYSHFLIRFNISSENNDFGFNSIQKINIQKNSHLNALGSKFDLDIK